MKKREKSIYSRMLFMIVTMIILPMTVLFSVYTSVLIDNLQENYNDTTMLSAYVSSQNMKEAVGSVIDVSISIIGNLQIKEYLQCSDRPENYYSIFENAEEDVRNYFQENKFVEGILVTSIPQSNYIAAGNGVKYPFTEEEIVQMESSRGGWFWQRQKDGKAAVCRLMRNMNQPSENVGYIKILLDENTLKNQITVGKKKEQFTYTIVDLKKKETAYSTGNQSQDMPDFLEKGEKEIFENENLYVYRSNGAYTVYKEMILHTRPVYFALTTSDQTVFYSVIRYASIGCIFVIAVVFYVLYASFYKKKIGAPLTDLSKHMKESKFRTGAPEQIRIPADGEVKELIDSFNSMSERLNELYETNYKNELKLRDANLLILQSEINPHFLYNVLDSCRWMIELGENAAASEMIQKLSEMFRLSLSVGEKSVVRLDQELDHVNRYISLEKIRIGEKVHFQMNIQKKVGNPMVVKFILQPLIENAIVHGILKNKGYGTVLISVYLSDHHLIYDVRDDGCGADANRIQQILEEKLVKKNSLEGFALENIQSRLKLRYGEDYGIEFSPREEGGSIFKVRQPLLYQEEEEKC